MTTTATAANGNGHVTAASLSVTTFAGVTTINALPAEVNLLLYRGDDFLMVVTATLLDGETPVDFAGFTIDAQVRATAASPDVIGEWDIGVWGDEVELHLPHAVSELLPPAAVYDVQTVAPDGFVLTLIRGTITATADVTRLAGP